MVKRIIKNLTQSQINYITGSYVLGKSAKKLAAEFETSRGTIFRLLKKCNITLRTPEDKLNYNFFDIIDTEAKAYFLGLMYADGSISDENRIELKLQNRDRHIIEEFRNYIAPGYKISFIDLSTKNPNHRDQYQLRFGNKIIGQQLVKLGCIPRKSLILEYPTEHIPKHLEHHFIRGYFDGDGSIFYTIKETKKYGKYLDFAFEIMSTKMFCKKVRQIIKENTGVELHQSFVKTMKNGITIREGNGITSSIKIVKNQPVYDIMTWLYTDATIFLQRKYDKYLILKSLIENKS